jgi:hypothetical protein
MRAALLRAGVDEEKLPQLEPISLEEMRRQARENGLQFGIK